MSGRPTATLLIATLPLLAGSGAPLPTPLTELIQGSLPTQIGLLARDNGTTCVARPPHRPRRPSVLRLPFATAEGTHPFAPSHSHNIVIYSSLQGDWERSYVDGLTEQSRDLCAAGALLQRRRPSLTTSRAASLRRILATGRLTGTLPTQIGNLSELRRRL